ncbi:MAG: hypothetical protein ACUVWJ_12545 [Spirochaetota bacterium]
MTGNEFQKKVIELLNKYHLNRRMKERIYPLFSMIENLSQEEMVHVYHLLEEAIIAQKEAEKLSTKLDSLFLDFNSTIQGVSKRLGDIKKKLDSMKQREASATEIDSGKNDTIPGSKESNRKDSSRNNLKINASTRRNGAQIEKSGKTINPNRHPLHCEKQHFGLKLTKLFAAFITEYGPDNITMVISDSILYTNNLILRISLKTKEVRIGSSKSLKIFNTKDGYSFLITEKPEVIPCGNKKGFYFKNITYEDILNLTNGDFFKVFSPEILEAYRKYQIDLPGELRDVGYYKFD